MMISSLTEHLTLPLAHSLALKSGGGGEKRGIGFAIASWFLIIGASRLAPSYPSRLSPPFGHPH
jgi:hypothetical protein